MAGVEPVAEANVMVPPMLLSELADLLPLSSDLWFAAGVQVSSEWRIDTLRLKSRWVRSELPRCIVYTQSSNVSVSMSPSWGEDWGQLKTNKVRGHKSNTTQQNTNGSWLRWGLSRKIQSEIRPTVCRVSIKLNHWVQCRAIESTNLSAGAWFNAIRRLY